MSTAFEPRDIRACVFDAYGTLLDFGSAVAGMRDRLGDRADMLNELWRRKQLEYTWLRTLMRRHADFRRVTEEALDYALEALGLSDDSLRSALLAAYDRLPPYPEVPEMLQRLRRADLRTAILSNGSPEMLDKGVRSAGIAELLDLVLSVEDVGVFKPDPEVYMLATRSLRLEARNILFLSSNAWDAAGAASFGFPTVWVNRSGAPRERLPGEPVAELDDLAGLPPLLGVSG